MRLICFVAEAAMAILVVVRPIAFEEYCTRVSLERENVGRNTIEKPAIMADDHGAAREAEERLLEGTHRIHIKIICRLVEKKDIGPLLEDSCEVNAVSFST